MTPSIKTLNPTDRAVDFTNSVWETIGAHLENARLLLQEEITHYPPPIPACDADFNHLLEERARIGEELSRMHIAAGKSLAPLEAANLIEEFVLSSNYIDDTAKQEIKSWLNKSRSECGRMKDGRVENETDR